MNKYRLTSTFFRENLHNIYPVSEKNYFFSCCCCCYFSISKAEGKKGRNLIFVQHVIKFGTQFTDKAKVEEEEETKKLHKRRKKGKLLRRLNRDVCAAPFLI